MSTATLLQRLRPGLDPNDTSWLLVHTAADWRAAPSTGVAFDAGHQALQLSPQPQPELAPHWLPQEPVAAADGTLYRCDPVQHLVLAKARCADDFVPLPGVGGRGFATGRFDTPLGLAIDAQGLLLVADAGNARVQAILPHHPRAGNSASVVAVLDASLRLPVHVAVGPSGEIFVVDRGTGRVHVFSARFAPLRSLPLCTLDPWTGEAWRAPPAAYPLAIFVTPQGTLAVLDPMRAWLWHLSTGGTALPALPWPAADALPAGWSALPRRHAAQGEVLLGPLDSGRHNFAWHQLLIDAQLPPGTSLSVQTHADNDVLTTLRNWAPRAPVPLTRSDPEAVRLVLPDDAGFARRQLGRLARVQAVVHRFDSGGPSGTANLSLPAEAARMLRVGDLVELTTPAGGSNTARVAAAMDWPTQVATSGSAAAFTAPTSLRLLQRRAGELPFEPLDLSFLVNPTTLALAVPAARDGRPEAVEMPLPHVLAAFLQTGDVVELCNAQGTARIEIAASFDGMLALSLDAAMPGDFSQSALSLLESPQRLLVALALALSLPCPLPPGARVTVFSDVHTTTEPLLFIETSATGASALWLPRNALQHPVTAASWTALQFPEPRATDHGRYLWVRMQLRGAALRAPDGLGPAVQADASPSVFSLRATGPRPSLLRWLPAAYGRRDEQVDAPGANFLERFLTLFEGCFTQIEAAFDSVGRLLNPQAADTQWLSFVASWLDLVFDPSWPIERRRQLVIEGAALQAARGTSGALRRYLEIYTGAPVAITEGFQRHPPLPIQLGARGALGVAPLAGDPAVTAQRLANLAHRFTVSVQLPPEIENAAAASAVRQIVETVKPAHTRFVLDLGRNTPPRVGIDTAVDMVVVPGDGDPCACNPDVPDGGATRGALQLGTRLGSGGIAQRVFQGART